MNDYIYIIAPIKGYPCKIGITSNIQQRIQGMQSGCWEKLEVVASFKCKNGPIMERQILNYFRSKLLRGEWFDVYTGEAIQMINEFIEQCNEDIPPINHCKNCGTICSNRWLYCSQHCRIKYHSKK